MTVRRCLEPNTSISLDGNFKTSYARKVAGVKAAAEEDARGEAAADEEERLMKMATMRDKWPRAGRDRWPRAWRRYCSNARCKAAATNRGGKKMLAAKPT